MKSHPPWSKLKYQRLPKKGYIQNFPYNLTVQPTVNAQTIFSHQGGVALERKLGTAFLASNIK